MDFLESKATKKLSELAKEPIDLTKEGILSPDRVAQMSSCACGLNLLYATERVTDDVIQALSNLANDMQVIDKMRAMQNGEIVNKIEGVSCENRAVLHTAMRDIFTSKLSPMANLAKLECDKLELFIEKIDLEDKFTNVLLVGIGGSYLGPKALYLALKAYANPKRQAYFISNVDPDDAASVLKNLDLKKTLVIIESKSGTTLETVTNESIVRKKFEEKGLNPKDHFIAVTGQNSPMDDPEKYLASFYIWDCVGGRFSATSMVGGVLFAFTLGFDKYMDILKGANDMDKVALNTNINENLPLLAALLGVWNRNFLKYNSLACVPYSQALVRFVSHLQQCDMESNGKSIDKNGKTVPFETGPIVWGEPGTDGQHSFHQFLHQGTDIIPIEFIGFKESQYEQDLLVDGTTSQQKLLANLFAQSIAFATGKKSDNPNCHFPGNKPNRILLAKKLDPYTMGVILSFYEHKITFQGFLWNINSFDQEGVQLGKTLATKILDTYQDKTSFPLVTAFTKHLENL